MSLSLHFWRTTLLGIILSQYFEYVIPLSTVPQNFFLRNLLIVLWGGVHHMCWLAFIFFKKFCLLKIFDILIITCLNVALFGFNLLGIFCAHESDFYFPSHVYKVFSHYCLKYTFCLFAFSFLSGIPIMHMLFLLMMSHNSCRLSSHFFFSLLFLSFFILWPDSLNSRIQVNWFPFLNEAAIESFCWILHFSL